MVSLGEDLMGADVAAVCARLGPPLGCRHVDGVLRLTYADRDGEALDGAVQLADGVVVRVAADACRSGAVGRGARLAGGPVEDLPARFGAPRRAAWLGDSVCYEFDGAVVVAHGGVVAYAALREPRAAASRRRASEPRQGSVSCPRPATR